MGNYVTAVRNYLIATPSQLGNYKIADMKASEEQGRTTQIWLDLERLSCSADRCRDDAEMDVLRGRAGEAARQGGGAGHGLPAREGGGAHGAGRSVPGYCWG
jgi:hypothetical protein